MHKLNKVYEFKEKLKDMGMSDLYRPEYTSLDGLDYTEEDYCAVFRLISHIEDTKYMRKIFLFPRFAQVVSDHFGKPVREYLDMMGDVYHRRIAHFYIDAAAHGTKSWNIDDIAEYYCNFYRRINNPLLDELFRGSARVNSALSYIYPQIEGHITKEVFDRVNDIDKLSLLVNDFDKYVQWVTEEMVIDMCVDLSGSYSISIRERLAQYLRDNQPVN